MITNIDYMKIEMITSNSKITNWAPHSHEETKQKKKRKEKNK